MSIWYYCFYTRRTILGVFIFICLATTNVSANMAFKSDNALMGAGAHFSWIVFDALKADLERATGRNTILFGKFHDRRWL